MARKQFFETDEFKKLNAKWAKRLKASGFEDIETGEIDGVIRPQIIKTNKTQYDGGNAYYELCHSILREYSFRKEIHRTIFTKHAEGMSERDIVRWVLDNQGIRFSQQGVNTLINRVKEDYLKGAK